MKIRLSGAITKAMAEEQRRRAPLRMRWAVLIVSAVGLWQSLLYSTPLQHPLDPDSIFSARPIPRRPITLASIGLFGSPTSGDVHAPGLTVALTKPASVTGSEILIASLASGRAANTPGTWTAPAGWTPITTSVSVNGGGASSINICCFWALGNVASTTFTKSGTVDDFGYVVAAYDGCDLIAPIDSFAAGTSSSGASSVSASTFTINNAGAMHLVACCDWLGGSITATSFTKIENGATNESAALLYNTTPKSAGASGAVTVNSSAATSGQLMLAMPFALKPASTSFTWQQSSFLPEQSRPPMEAIGY